MLLYDEVNAFFALPLGMKKIYHGFLYPFEEYRAFFDYVEFEPSSYSMAQMIRDAFQDRICENADLDALIQYYPKELAYTLALLDADDRYSITPRWLQYHFPKIDHVIKFLCNTPCIDTCEYCKSRLDVHRGLQNEIPYRS